MPLTCSGWRSCVGGGLHELLFLTERILNPMPALSGYYTTVLRNGAPLNFNYLGPTDTDLSLSAASVEGINLYLK